MKLLYTLLLTFFFNLSFSQSVINWSPEVDIASSSFSNLHPRIVTDRTGNPIVIWGNFSNNEINFSRWDGTAFTTPVILNPSNLPVFTASWAGPDIASHGDTVYVVVKQTPEDTNHVFIIRSFDGGITFSAPIQVEHLTDSASRFPTVATDSIGNPIVAYMKFEQGFINASYVVARSNDFGTTFGNDVLASSYLSENVCDCCPAAFISSGNYGAMLYRTNFNNFRTIWCGVSTDNCASFPFGMQVDQTGWQFNACPSTGPDGVIIGDSVYTVFMSGQTGDARCYMSPSSLTQTVSGPTRELTDSTAFVSNQNYPRIAHSGNKVAVVCKQINSNFDGQLAFFYTDDIYSGLPQTYDSLAMGNITNGDVEMTADAIHVVWQDDNSETVKYRKGTFSPTQTTNPGAEKLFIYPTPSKDKFTIITNKNTTVTSVELIDALGQTILIPFFASASSIDCNLKNVSAGVYLVKAHQSDATLLIGKIVVQ